LREFGLDGRPLALIVILRDVAPPLQICRALQAGLRPARPLLGWMHPEDAQRVLVSNRGDAQASAEQVRAVESAHQAVSRRATFENELTLEHGDPLK
jgi:hypothetical protein